MHPGIWLCSIRLNLKPHSAPIAVERLSFHQRAEIHDLHLRERAHQECHEVADFVSNRLVSVEAIGNPQRMAIYREAIEHFRVRMPTEVIRRFTDAAIAAELHCRAEIAVERRKMARSAGTRAMVS